MKNFIVNLISSLVMTVWVIIFLLVVSTCATKKANANGLDEVSINYYNFTPGGQDPLITSNGLSNKELGKELILNINTTFLDYFYWKNTIHSMTDQTIGTTSGQFRTVGWQFYLGMHLTDWLNVEYRHHSQHLLDATLPYHFPVNDAVGINIILYSKTRSESLL